MENKDEGIDIIQLFYKQDPRLLDEIDRFTKTLLNRFELAVMIMKAIQSILSYLQAKDISQSTISQELFNAKRSEDDKLIIDVCDVEISATGQSIIDAFSSVILLGCQYKSVKTDYCGNHFIYKNPDNNTITISIQQANLIYIKIDNYSFAYEDNSLRISHCNLADIIPSSLYPLLANANVYYKAA